MGASVVNALSARLDVQVDRDGHIHEISFRRGVPGVFVATVVDVTGIVIYFTMAKIFLTGTLL